MTAWLFFCLFMAVSSSVQAEKFSGKVVRVIDGDTVMVLRNCASAEPQVQGSQAQTPCKDRHPVKIRLAGIDAPEKAQEYGMASRQVLVDLVQNKLVRVITHAVDDYGRLVAEINVDGWNVNHEQIRRGMAWEYSRFHGDKMLVAMEHEARAAKRGLWAQANPVPPQKWRKAHAVLPLQAATQDTNCGNKRHCAEMISCDESKFYFSRCGVRSLDGDKDGMPCENLCAVNDNTVSK